MKSLAVNMSASSNDCWACWQSFHIVLTKDQWLVYMVSKCLYSKAFSQGLSSFLVNAQYETASTKTSSSRVVIVFPLVWSLMEGQ